MPFKVPEKYRYNPIGSKYPETKEGDDYGFFRIPYKDNPKKVRMTHYIFVMASSGDETTNWQHVSVSVKSYGGKELERCPVWPEMCVVKDLFWDDTDAVVQFYPPKDQYVNQHKFTLHLWRNKKWDNKPMTLPDPELVGHIDN